MMDTAYDFRLGVDGSFDVTEDVLKTFRDTGYIIIRGLLDQDELNKVKEVIENPDVLKFQYGRPDKSGKEPKLILWQHPGDDVTGMVARCRKVASTCEKLLGGEVYHNHTKLVTKYPYIGGTFEWHQDYGYWYKYGCLFPDMMSVFVAVDQCKKANGCLQLLSGSHKCGRIDHTIIAHQTGADVDRVKDIQGRLQHVHAELNAGDALFFHCNVLHTSSDNTSSDIRRGLIMAYNRKSNNPGPHQKHPGYRPLNQVPDDAVRLCTNTTNFEGKDFWIVQPQI